MKKSLKACVAFFKHREEVVGVTCVSAGDLPSWLMLSQGVPSKPKFLLAGFKQLWPARRAVRSFLPQHCKWSPKFPASPSGGQRHLQVSAGWCMGGSLLCALQWKALGNLSSLCSFGNCREPLLRLRNVWWPTWVGAGKRGQVGSPGVREELSSQPLSQDAWWRQTWDCQRCVSHSNLQKEKGEWKGGRTACLYLGIRGVLGLASALVRCWRSSFYWSAWRVLWKQCSLQHGDCLYNLPISVQWYLHPQSQEGITVHCIFKVRPTSKPIR